LSDPVDGAFGLSVLHAKSEAVAIRRRIKTRYITTHQSSLLESEDKSLS
jgi:hypothetical protein